MFKLKNALKLALNNKVIWYMVSRYATYAIQFVVSLIIAEKLGPFQLGIWGFVLLLINYFNIFNFGIPNSATVLMVQNKADTNKSNNIELSAIFLLCIVSAIIICIGIYYSIFGIPFFEKYQIGNLFYYVCVIAVLQHFTSLFSLISRVKGFLVEVAFSQSIIAILLLIASLCFHGRNLLICATLCYLIGNLFSISVFIINKNISFNGKPYKTICREIINKGKFLFVYNVCFYLIFLSTKTIVSAYYPVEQFGFFTFAYTLSNAVLLCLQAFTSIAFPKLIDKMNSDDLDSVEIIIKKLRVCYVTFSHGLMYIAMSLFPIIISLMPKYKESLSVIYFMALSLLLYSNSFGYSTLLIAKNNEKRLSLISFLVLVFNVGFALFLSKYLRVDYKYVTLATMGGYLLFSLLCVIRGEKILQRRMSFRKVMSDFFPYQLLIPYVLAVIGTSLNYSFSPLLVCFVFAVLNYSSIQELIILIKTIFLHPNIVDIQK